MVLRKSILLVVVLCILASGVYAQQSHSSEPIRPFNKLIPSHVMTVSADIIAIRIPDNRKEIEARQLPYVPREGDRILEPDRHQWLIRDGKAIGSLVGKDRKLMATFSSLEGREIKIDFAMEPSNWRIQSVDDPAYLGRGLEPLEVYRKTKPSNMLKSKQWGFEVPLEHVLYLKIPRALSSGRHYRIVSESSDLQGMELQWLPETTRSEAVHVSHAGFRTDDPVKTAFLSCWMGDGGGAQYEAGLSFHVLDEKGRKVFSGKTALSKAADDATEDARKRNYNNADIYIMDFSGLDQAGTYRVYVEGVGCSYPFPVGDDVWLQDFYVSVRGLYHMRNGIALGPPYTDYVRPRCFHPDDGLVVLHSTAPLMYTGNGGYKKDKSNFGFLNAGRTDQVVANAWGGLMDAGDWDRRIQHMVVTELMADLALMYPEFAEKTRLNIPESDNHIPDILDEAMFNLDCYRRMQTAEGGIRGGIESAEHPNHGETSWQESLPVMAYAPGVWSSYWYAAAAARTAFALKRWDKDLAQVYEVSAIRAMDWAEKERPNLKEIPDNKVPDSRNYAAAELYRLTGDARYHTLFLETTAFKKPGMQLSEWQKHDQAEAAWTYLQTPEKKCDPSIRDNCRSAILKTADMLEKTKDKTGFKWIKEPYAPIGWGLVPVPQVSSLIRAWQITGDDRYLKGVLYATQFGRGANADNMCYTTGVGQNWPKHPLHVDTRYSPQGPPKGLTVFGPTDLVQYMKPYQRSFFPKHMYPTIEEWPPLESFLDVDHYPAICEYTVQRTIGPNAYIWGFLAARE
ncbi:MAG: glycoside hydrolase family 9 protein [bacterium]